MASCQICVVFCICRHNSNRIIFFVAVVWCHNVGVGILPITCTFSIVELYFQPSLYFSVCCKRACCNAQSVCILLCVHTIVFVVGHSIGKRRLERLFDSGYHNDCKPRDRVFVLQICGLSQQYEQQRYCQKTTSKISLIKKSLAFCKGFLLLNLSF